MTRAVVVEKIAPLGVATFIVSVVVVIVQFVLYLTGVVSDGKIRQAEINGENRARLASLEFRVSKVETEHAQDQARDMKIDRLLRFFEAEGYGKGKVR